jgi:hypothetical protein
VRMLRVAPRTQLRKPPQSTTVGAPSFVREGADALPTLDRRVQSPLGYQFMHARQVSRYRGASRQDPPVLQGDRSAAISGPQPGDCHAWDCEPPCWSSGTR